MQVHKILIVDDHDDFRNSLKELLEDELWLNLILRC